ncbi:TVP38/TMEM64 family protein [Cohnella laeviribosi]|uniref:TVP38/TMEM64 family protein n=1 Tax=Cohnella laeviribosi TaxID=380174 RepID=UPI0003657F41|nr:VTT domain-containing protein [Cohnella laeviribosi]
MDWFIPVDDLAEWLASFGFWAILLSLLLSAIIAILGIMPSLFLSGANAVVFGLIPGFWISLSGEVLGAGVSFWLYRRGFGNMRPVQEGSWVWLKRLNEASRKRRAVILLLARLIPLLPSGIITFAAAVSHMRFWDFILVTFIGKVPSIAMETLIGHDFIRIEENYPRLLFSLLFLVFIYILMRKR